MERRKLSEQEVSVQLAGLNGWAAEDDKLKKSYKFADFAESLRFVNRVGELADAADHHPDIKFGWGYAELEITTHDRGGVTDVDVALARAIDISDSVDSPPLFG